MYSNAIKFTGKCGLIVIMIEKIVQRVENDMIIISVIDSGIGIRKKDQGKLFKLFGSIKNQKKNINTEGIGLGLVISKLIVSKFNGKIDFKSKWKKGSTFFFSIQTQSFTSSEI